MPRLFSRGRFCSLFASLLSFGVVSLAAAQSGPRPNLILIITDDQQWATISAMPAVQTNFAQQGIKFTNVFATTALCSPSRASILSGQYAYHHGVHDNDAPDGGFQAFDDASTVATWLRTAGYCTGLYGKYLNGYNGTYVPPGWTEWHGSQKTSYYDYDLNENGVIVHYGTAPRDYFTDVVADKAVDFIRSSNGTPFFLCFTPFAPHEPATPANRHKKLFSNLAPWRPPNYDEADVSDKPAWLRSIPLLSAATKTEMDTLRRNQHRALQAVDEAVADIIAAVNQIGATQNTIIIFMGDNGYLWGEHRLTDKAYSFEEAIRIPLLVRAPGISTGPRVENRLVLNMDIASTLAEFAGVTPATPVDGASLVPIINNTATNWRTDFWFEHWAKNKGQTVIPEHIGVRNANWKYIEYSNSEKELYDVANDPYELVSRANDPAYFATQAQLAARLQVLKNSRGCTASPAAAFTTTPTSGNVPLTVNFTDQSTNFASAWLWNFGDGTTSTAPNPSHQYTVPGIYTVTLTASNSCGNNSVTKTNHITVNCAQAPVVAFTATPTSGNAPLTVNFSDQSANFPSAWSWNFGDGNTSTVRNPSHQYTTPGSYTVTLTASNNCGNNSLTKANYITVNCAQTPVVAFTATPTSGAVPLTVSFTDQSTNFPTAWLWNFGDGNTSTLRNLSYQYTAPGIYSVTLTATNSCGNNTLTKTNYITVNCAQAPVAAFAGTPTSGAVPLTVTFTDQSTNFPTVWSWNFGDGNTSTLRNPSYQYTAPGIYSVTLTATNSCGNNSLTKTNYITVNCAQAPVAAFTGAPTSGNAPLTVNFTDQSTNFPSAWSWNFGDGATSTTRNPSLQYTAPGIYSVTLTATNSCGNNSLTKTNYITVNCAQAPVAAFAGTPTSGSTPLTVSFTDQSTNFPTAWLWNFGDGNTSTTRNPSYQYTTPGIYTVTLTATNSCGNNSLTKTNYITVTGGPPVNLARNKPASAASTANGFPAGNAVDGNNNSYWRSGAVSANTAVWWAVDLGATHSINNVVINWRESHYAAKYSVQVSLNSSTWTTVYTDNAGNGGVDNVSFATAAARYVLIRITQNNGSSERLNEVEVYAASSQSTKVAAEEMLATIVPDEIVLQPNYPNPFSASGAFGNPSTQISFSVPSRMQVMLKIYNLRGQEVATLVNEIRARGNHTAIFNAAPLMSGIYFAVLQAGEVRQMRRLVYLK